MIEHQMSASPLGERAAGGFGDDLFEDVEPEPVEAIPAAATEAVVATPEPARKTPPASTELVDATSQTASSAPSRPPVLDSYWDALNDRGEPVPAPVPVGLASPRPPRVDEPPVVVSKQTTTPARATRESTVDPDFGLGLLDEGDRTPAAAASATEPAGTDLRESAVAADSTAEGEAPRRKRRRGRRRRSRQSSSAQGEAARRTEADPDTERSSVTDETASAAEPEDWSADDVVTLDRMPNESERDDEFVDWPADDVVTLDRMPNEPELDDEADARAEHEIAEATDDEPPEVPSHGEPSPRSESANRDLLTWPETIALLLNPDHQPESPAAESDAAQPSAAGASRGRRRGRRRR